MPELTRAVARSSPPATSRRPSPRSSEGVKRGDRFQTLLGITGSGKSATIAWTIEAGAEAHADPRPQQEPRRPAGPGDEGVLPARTGWSTSSATTTTTSPRRTSPRATPTSRRTRRSTTRSTGCATRPPRRSSPGATRSSSPRSPASTAWATRTSTGASCWSSTPGVDYDQRSILRRLVDLQYDRNDLTLGRGKFRVRGDTIEVHPAYDETVLRIEMFGDTVERLTIGRPADGRAAERARASSSSSRPRTTSPARSGCGGRSPDRGRAAGAAGLLRARRASCSRRSACACAPSTTWR